MAKDILKVGSNGMWLLASPMSWTGWNLVQTGGQVTLHFTDLSFNE
jgi:hypothetical protein